MSDTVKAALIAAVASIVSAWMTLLGVLVKTRPRRDRRKSFRARPHGERRKDPMND